MTVTCVHIQVKEEFIELFKQACEENHQQSIKENGNFRFDVLQNESDTCNFMLYEAYTSEEAALAHKQTAHYAAWRDKVASWMAQPRNGIKYKMLCPKK